MTLPGSRPALVAVIGSVLALAACTAPGVSGPPDGNVSAAVSVAPSPSAASSPSPTTSPESTDATADTPIAAARAFLELSSARFEAAADRFKPGEPVEHEWNASGVVDPAGDRGSMRWRLLFPPIRELEPAETPQPPLEADIVWDATDYWGAGVRAAGNERRWTHTTRERAREAAMIGRVQEEPLGLIRLAAEADRSAVEPMPPATLGGDEAERWLIDVPLERAKATFVPPDTYLSLPVVFDVQSFPLEVWIVDGQIRRVGYVLEREKAPYGGPDRFETYYDWSDFNAEIDVEIPPTGRIIELGEDDPPIPTDPPG